MDSEQVGTLMTSLASWVLEHSLCLESEEQRGLWIALHLIIFF